MLCGSRYSGVDHVKLVADYLLLPNIPDYWELLRPGIIFVSKKEEYFTKNKNKLRSVWGCKPLKNKNIELHQYFTCSVKKVLLSKFPFFVK